MLDSFADDVLTCWFIWVVLNLIIPLWYAQVY